MSQHDRTGPVGGVPAARPDTAKGNLSAGLLLAAVGVVIVLVSVGGMVILNRPDVPDLRIFFIIVLAILVSGLAMVLGGLVMCVKGLVGRARAGR